MKHLLVLAAAFAWMLTGSLQAQTYPSAQTNQNYPSAQNPNYPSAQPNGAYQANQPVYANNSQNGVIPAGAELQIRTNQAINATSQNVGQTYPAEVAQNVVDQNGAVIIPQGSPATLSVGKVSGGGVAGLGSNQVALGLQSVSINGVNYHVNTNPAQQQSSNQTGVGANKRTAEMTGGGALLGTVIGAIAGGGKGAAIGAVVGGAGGAATQVITRGNQVTVPAETLVTFKLDQPVTLQRY
jgi:hypothetical protein